jgi:hypothetical protein
LARVHKSAGYEIGESENLNLVTWVTFFSKFYKDTLGGCYTGNVKAFFLFFSFFFFLQTRCLKQEELVEDI